MADDNNTNNQEQGVDRMCQLLLGKLFIAIFTEVTSCTLLFQHLSNAF